MSEAEPPAVAGPHCLDSIEDPDAIALAQTGKNIPAALWERIIQRGTDVVDPLHRFLAMADVLVYLADGEDERAECALWGHNHAFFLLCEIGHPSSVPFVLKLAQNNDDNEWMAEGLAWGPRQTLAALEGRLIALDRRDAEYITLAALRRAGQVERRVKKGAGHNRVNLRLRLIEHETQLELDGWHARRG